MANSISEDQLALNRSLHQSDPSFGNRDQASGVATQLPFALLRMHEAVVLQYLITELVRVCLSNASVATA